MGEHLDKIYLKDTNKKMRGTVKSRQKLSWAKAVKKYYKHRKLGLASSESGTSGSASSSAANEREYEFDIIDWDDPGLIVEDGILYLKTNVPNRVAPIPAPRIIQTKTSLKGFVKEYTIKSHNMTDEETFLNRCRLPVINFLSRNRNTKVRMILGCVMTKQDNYETKYFKSGSATEILEATDLPELYDIMVDNIKEEFATFLENGSAWRLHEVVKLVITINEYKPLRGSSYADLPKCIKDKKAIINIKNEDNQCFKWCVTRALNPVKVHPERVTGLLKEQSKNINWNDIEFPVKLTKINKFETNNCLSINIFANEGETSIIHPLRISKVEGFVINLLLYKGHYCLIKDFGRLVNSQLTKHHGTRFYCYRCINSFVSEYSLKEHEYYCKNHEARRIIIDDKPVKFKNYNHSMRVPFVIYADFESFNKPIYTCENTTGKSFTNRYQKHVPSSFSFYVKSIGGAEFEQVSYTALLEAEPEVPLASAARGLTNEVRLPLASETSEEDDVAQIFVEMLERYVKDIYQKYEANPAKMIFTAEDKIAYENAKHCHICEGGLNDLSEKKVRDHCHITGKFRGAAHSACNINYRLPKFYPVIMHNLSGYDAHLFIKKLGGDITCIPNTDEKYISFSKDITVGEYKDKKGITHPIKRQLRFIDSFKFMASSLEQLLKNVKHHPNLEKYYQGEQLKLLLKKGVYPYDYVDSVERFNETQLPPKEAFYSKLNDEGISDEEYEHAQNVWKVFEMKTFRDYHNLYNKADVLQLADIFENFRDVCMNNYKLDPAWYYTAPGLAWDACLKLTKIELEIPSDYDMLLMIKAGTRGGVSSIMHRHSVANNKYMENYDKNKESKFITYLDANNLYGWAMSQALPIGNFKWMEEKELENWRNTRGCILEVDLEYPKELHDLHNEYPLAPENIVTGGVSKLIPNLNNKTKYVLHYSNLKLYTRLGMRITKIHRGISFNESNWMKQYIDLNTNLRTKATNDFEKDFFKLMNNSVFGKTMENIEKRVDVRLVTDRDKAIKLSAKPNYNREVIFDENLIAIHMNKTKIKYDKPIYLGMCILDISKTLIYEFHYNYIKPKYGERAKLLFTDTDSLCYEITTDDFYKDIADDVESKFDTSDYPKDHPSITNCGFKIGMNKKVIGYFKDECAGKQITEFVGLRSKCYAYSVDGKESKKCKGTKKGVVKKHMTINHYRRCLYSFIPIFHSQKVIRSHKHEMYTETINKKSLSADDDKRVILGDMISTLALGHYRLETM